MARKSLTTLVIDQFDVPVDLAHNFQCGGVDGAFNVDVELSARELTAEGFVIEVGQFMDTVRHAFRDGMLVASCESLAGGVVNVAVRALQGRLERIVVEVENLTGHVRVEWNEGEEVPAFPRLATAEEREKTLEERKCGHPQSRSVC